MEFRNPCAVLVCIVGHSWMGECWFDAVYLLLWPYFSRCCWKCELSSRVAMDAPAVQIHSNNWREWREPGGAAPETELGRDRQTGESAALQKHGEAGCAEEDAAWPWQAACTEVWTTQTCCSGIRHEILPLIDRFPSFFIGPSPPFFICLFKAYVSLSHHPSILTVLIHCLALFDVSRQ